MEQIYNSVSFAWNTGCYIINVPYRISCGIGCALQAIVECGAVLSHNNTYTLKKEYGGTPWCCLCSAGNHFYGLWDPTEANQRLELLNMQYDQINQNWESFHEAQRIQPSTPKVKTEQSQQRQNPPVSSSNQSGRTSLPLGSLLSGVKTTGEFVGSTVIAGIDPGRSQKQVTTDDFSLQDFYSLITIDHDQLRTAVSRSLETRRISSVDGLCTALYSEKCKPSDPQHHLEYWSNLQIPQNLTLETLTNHLQNFRLPPPAIQNPHLKDCFTEMDNAIRHSIYSLPQNRQFATFCSWVHKLPEVARAMVQNPRNAQQIAETYRGEYDVSTWRTPWAVIKDEYRALYYTTRLEKLFSLYIAAESTHRYGVPIGGITTFSLLLSPTRSLALMGFLYLPVANFFLINGCDLLSGYVTDGPNPCSAFSDKLTTDLKTSLHPITYFLLSWGTVAAFSPAFQRGFFGTLSTISSPALIGTATKRFITESPPVQYACSLGRVFYKLGSAIVGGGRGAINAWKGA